MAGGAVETPRLLLLSGSSTRLIGRYLMCHYQTIVVGTLPERLHGERGRSVTHVHDDAIDRGRRSRGPRPRRRACRGSGAAWSSTAAAVMPIMEATTYPWGPMHKQLDAGLSDP